ncbi:hypothetical protein SASPL_100273 [Salvia splendens]|uniref:Splicing factor Cactin n=1 Tax=Salvia splendens TaxID=180675 RepID=A0A8X8YPH1_SALSN|nr:hypothetical protein SASPL_100273 [Salvia splendens]
MPRRRHSDDSSSESPSDSDRRSGKRRRSESVSKRRRRRDSDSDSDDPSKRKSSSSKRKITEDEITEYLAKKAQKKAMKVAKKLKLQSKDVSGYSNDSNPFGDSNLNEKKKIEKDVSQGVPLDEFSLKSEKKRQKERKFHFDQGKIRSEIRLREGRMKPIDILTKHLDHSDDFEIDINEPYLVFKGLTVKEMEELHNDIKMHLDLDRATPTHVGYWEALSVVSEWELAEARKKDALDRARVRGEKLPPEMIGEERGLHMSIEADVKSLLQGKTYSELEAMQSQIESQMRSGTAKVVEYWEAILKRLHIYKAKACLKEIHTTMLRRHLERLETPSEGENIKTEPAQELDEQESDQDMEVMEGAGATASPVPVTEVEAPDDGELAGSYSPQLLHGDEDEEEDAIDPEEDKASLERKRIAVKEDRRIQEISSRQNPPEDNFERSAMKTMGAIEEGDAVFGSSDEINLDSQVYWWHDKYRPRKPKYFNRVHTGYEWNKYNQTHYDHDNPPPKIVQGYKFNIFYPDLVDKQKAPIYTIEKDGDSGETCIIRFHAGPPYEDIAFRIVNKEWEYSHKKGFKCTFERGILHVYFNFKRYRYRR